MPAPAAFNLRIHRVRQDFEQLHRGLQSLASHLKVMTDISDNWAKAVDALQMQLNSAYEKATVLQKETYRVIAEANTLIKQAPRPNRNLRIGQTSAPPIRAELRGKARRLEKDACNLDRSLRAYHEKVHQMANDPLRHASGAEGAEVFALFDKILGQIGDIVEIIRGVRQMDRR